MTKSLALVVLGMAIVANACSASDHTGSAGIEASTPTAAEAARTKGLEKARADLDILKAGRQYSDGWAAKVRPGDARGIEGVSATLSKLELILDDLDPLGVNDQTNAMRGEVRSLMIEDLKLLLRMAQSDNRLSAVNQFVSIANGLDVQITTEFGITPDELRALALKSAKKELAEYRGHLGESSDMVGYAIQVVREWQFTPQELGLSAKDMEAIRQ